MAQRIGELLRLAQCHGIQTAYYDVQRRRHAASAESLIAVLRDLGLSIDSAADAPRLLEQHQATSADRGLEPVLVAWDGKLQNVPLCLAAHKLDRPARWEVRLEDGTPCCHDFVPQSLEFQTRTDVRGNSYETRSLSLHEPLPSGYHRLSIQVADRELSTLIIAAPKKSFAPPPRKPGNAAWGAFLPLYALHTAHSWGAGSYSDLQQLAEWVGSRGGSVLGTLPLLPAVLSGPHAEPSPYSPVSRLFWNEFYIDVDAIPEFADNAAARDLAAAATPEIQELQHLPHVDYQRIAAVKRRILETLCDDFFTHRPPRFANFQRYASAHPHLESYARFRAAQEQYGTNWTAWPEPLPDGNIPESAFNPRNRNYHLFTQWVASEQLRSAAHAAQKSGVSLYLDLPLGVNRDGYDVWKHRDVFARGITVGAPPDPVFTNGQNWGFCPLHPQAIRRQGYAYVRDFLAHHMQVAGMLRIDHAMGLHRLYWIPEGLPASRGVFVTYPAEELYAVLSLESHRHGTALVGENLGTVPSYVNAAMNRHRIRQMYVVQYELEPDRNAAINQVPNACVASLNTHDMPPFAAFWNGDDIDDRLDLGLLSANTAQAEREYRERLRSRLIEWLKSQNLLDDPHPHLLSVMQALLEFLAQSPAELLLVSLEDLWMETRPQNVPGTTTERPNWVRKAQHTLESFRDLPEVNKILDIISRKRSPPRTTTSEPPAKLSTGTTVSTLQQASPNK